MKYPIGISQIDISCRPIVPGIMVLPAGPGEHALQDIHCGTPVPVPDNLANPQSLLATQSEMGRAVLREWGWMGGLEGSVPVRLWVDATGHVRDAVIEQGDIDLFNDASLAAARQFVFMPAIMNDRPVAVWVSIPFTFSLQGPRE